MNVRQSFAVAILVIVSFASCVAASAFPADIITTEQVNVVKLLPPPPSYDSRAQKDDMHTVIALEKSRTPEQSAKAIADNEASVFRFADVLGAKFNEMELPRTAKFFSDLTAVHRAILIPSKDVWNRPRPFATNKDLHPIGELPKTGSYPSGHSHFGYLSAIILGAVVPERAPELMMRGVEFGNNRVLAGVHYPTDVEASRRVAAATATALLANPQFQSELAAVRAEVRTVLGYAN